VRAAGLAVVGVLWLLPSVVLGLFAGDEGAQEGQAMPLGGLWKALGWSWFIIGGVAFTIAWRL
jgi:hypothetical protein